MIRNASLDTSFWNIASQVGLVPYLFTYFRVFYCRAVEQEIITTDPAETPLIYPQAMLFQILREDGRLHQQEPKRPLSLFGIGEAHAIALAQEQSWLLLINDARPLSFAQDLGLNCIAVPDFTAFLYSQQRITLAAAHGCLRRLAATTSPALIKQAEQVVLQIAQKRGDGL
jgi:predicted nucleic acid-binding protein